MKHLVSINQLSTEDILRLLDRAALFEQNPNRKLLEGRVIATLFFEPSTRTRLSFETAVNRLGGRVIGFSDAATSSSAKGESLKDTISMVGNYADAIVMRHYLEGAALYAQSSGVPPSSMREMVPTSIPRRPCWTSMRYARRRAISTTRPLHWLVT